MLNGLLPIGSVVLLNESEKRVMIVGFGQKSDQNPEKLWDYVGVLFPEGYMFADKLFLFDNDQIKQIYALGYQDIEQLSFKSKIDVAIEQLRTQEHK